MRPTLLLRTGEARLELGEFGPAGEALDAARSAATSIGALADALASELESLRLRWLIGAAGSDADLVSEVERLIGELESVGAEEGIARAYRLLATLQFTAGRWGSAERAFEAIIEHARRSGNETMQTRALVNLGVLAVYGPTPVEDGIARCSAILPRVAGDRRAVAGTSRSLAHLRAMVGDVERAREEYRQARRTLEDLGWNFDAALTSLDSGPIELIAGDPAVAESELRRDYEALERMGDKNYISTTAAYLAEALVRQGRDDEADRMADFSASLAADDDVLTQVVWRSALARVRARAGDDPDAAVNLAREAVRRARTSDDLNGLADALSALGETLLLVGRSDDAAVAFAEAAEHYALKGNVVSGHRAEERMEEIATRPLAGRANATAT
jgi:tetratricopeptide (TPR) repeat protein